jgi:hypothetical protein
MAPDAAPVPWSVPGCEATPLGREAVDGMIASRWQLDCAEPERLVLTEADPRTLVVRVGGQAVVLGPGQTEVSLVSPGWWRFGWLGMHHLWTGFDHVLLVLGLTALLAPRALVAAVTAFTVGHASTLWLASRGAVLPMAPVEAAIAASLVWLGLELVSDDDGVLVRQPVWVPLGIGAVHGLGFASALAEMAVPSASRVWAVLAFNLGLELAQLGVVAVGVLLLRSVPRAWTGWGIGLVGATLFWQRIGAWIGL